MKTVDSLLGIAKAILARLGAGLTGVLAFPGVIDVPTPLRAALVVVAAWCTGSAVWLAKNKVKVEAGVSSAVSVAEQIGSVIDPGLVASLKADVAKASDKVDALVAGLSEWALAQDVPYVEPAAPAAVSV